MFKSSPPEVFLGKGAPKICSKFTREHPCQSVISIRLLSNFIEIAVLHGFFLVNLLHIFRTPSYKNTYGRILLNVSDWTLEINKFQIFLENPSICINPAHKIVFSITYVLSKCDRIHSCGFDHIQWRNPWCKTSFNVQRKYYRTKEIIEINENIDTVWLIKIEAKLHEFCTNVSRIP